MVMLKKGDCEHCGCFYRYSLWHSGFGDNSYAYCDDCGMLALLNYSNEYVASLPSPVDKFGEIESSWEQLLEPCPCGGRFRKGASPRCPSCREKLSAAHAAGHIESQALGARGWTWQNSWSGIYCVAMNDPVNPGSVLQVIDPILKPERTKAKKRWSLLFSFGR
ncbi:MAG: hypothetical protein JST28_18820 [Acidobacteria bacterium]|nr:hypothetical protein [Acidobacteriota bacterium]